MTPAPTLDLTTSLRGDYQTVPHHPLTPNQGVPQHQKHMFSVTWYPCPYAYRANCAPVWFSEILLPRHKDHIQPMVHKVHKAYGGHVEQHVHSIWHAPKAPRIFSP